MVFATGTLDYEFYKAKVQPIFLAKRPGHAPCVVCHAEANNMFRLEKLPPANRMDRGADAQEFRHGFENRRGGGRSADRQDTASSAGAEAGGDAFHSGGRQFASKSDPNWKIIAQWAQGATLMKK